MAWSDIIAYMYEGDHHCIRCTKKKWDDGLLQPTPETISLHGSGIAENEQDQHGIPYAAADDEMNNIHPLLSIDEWINLDPDYLKEYPEQTLECGTCHDVIDTWKEWE